MVISCADQKGAEGREPPPLPPHTHLLEQITSVIVFHSNTGTLLPSLLRKVMDHPQQNKLMIGPTNPWDRFQSEYWHDPPLPRKVIHV